MSQFARFDVPDRELFQAIAEEAALRDRDLAEMEAELSSLVDAEGDSGRIAKLSLVLGRAAWVRGATPMRRARSKMLARGLRLEATVIDLARELLHDHPSVERAEAGYRYGQEPDELYVEDPVAAHWHRRDRFGPGIRPDREHAARLLSEATTGALDQMKEGAVFVLCFPPGVLSAPAPALRLCLAGWARDPSLRGLVRWSSVDSIGRMGRKGAVAIHVRGSGYEVLPDRSAIENDALEALLVALLKEARS